MADKIGGLTSEETFMVLEKLAKFHAASYVYLEKAQVLKKAKEETNKEDILTVHVFAKSDGVVDGVHTIFMNGIYFDMIDILKEKKIVEEGLIEKILKFSKDPLETILKGSRLSAEKYFNVVNHGDLWVNNFLFKYDENDVTKPIDVRFIDFQQCRYSSVFDELHYFLYTSTSVQFRKENLAKCLHFYYDTFTTMLNVLNYPLPNGFTEEAFNSGYYEFLNAGFCYALMAVPFQVGAPPTPNEGGNEETQAKSSPQPGEKSLRELILSVFQSGPLKQAALNSSIAINRLRELCLEMDNLGVFNIE
ncbi:hypothetical protein Ocin01_00155 [Orchesella cincta]|uniref:CHK kinase-like domain-containing protein n=1 Tax=Orchesella cincta TaxID=48709 RepID=A0A1D2NNQ0_ORCCI|nr:hypothetical protein Ocin01_00155 [Orchesella cincta]